MKVSKRVSIASALALSAAAVFALGVETTRPTVASSQMLPANAKPLAYPVVVDLYALRTSDLIGQRVQNGRGETVGLVEDLILTGDRRVPYAILAVGGFMGIGQRKVAIPFDALERRPSGVYIFNVSADDLRLLPEFTWPAAK